MIDHLGAPRLGDFGLGRIVIDTSIMAGTSTNIGAGSLRWMAPELIQPSQFGLKIAMPNAESDVYALGCVYLEVRNLYLRNSP